MIKRETRRNIVDHIKMENIHFSGRMGEYDFLSRIYDLEKLPSLSTYHKNAFEEIKSYEEDISYYREMNWIFNDTRFRLLGGEDELFLRFICEMAHPLVRANRDDATKITRIANEWLKEDGWELFPLQEKAVGKIFSFRQTTAVQKPKEDEVVHIWEHGKLRFFISHRDKHKADAKKLGEELSKYSISSFVAHDSIQAMSTWKHEIMKALQTMDACLCYITSDFYDSEWTNQEVGFALAKGIPIYLYSVDKTDPKGFKLDTQAIKTGLPDLIGCIKKDFTSNSAFKKIYLDKLITARDGSFDLAKEKFFDVVGLRFNDAEIEEIIKAVSPATGIRESVNKLNAILQDAIKDGHRTHPLLRKYTSYRQYLENDIIAHHSSKTFSFKQIGPWGYEVIEGRKK